MNVPCRQCNTPVDEHAAICPVCGAANPAQRHGPPPGSATMQTTAVNGGVVIRDIDIPFGRLVMLIIKVMVASIPAYIILTVVFLIFFGVLGGIFGALMPGLLNSGAGM